MFIDPKSAIPIYQQISDQIRNAIQSGVYRAGEMLPSLRQMAIDIKVNPNTVQRAYDQLEREGVVETRRGVGVFVASFSRDRLNGAEKQLRGKLLEAIAQGTKSGLTIAKIRSTFEMAVREHLQEVTK